MSSGDSSIQPNETTKCADSEEQTLKEKKSCILNAVVENNLDALRDLLDSPKWYDMDASASYSYLQLAILSDSKEVFDYMLSIPDFPLEYINFRGQTALVVALDGYIAEDRYTSDHYSYELVKKGACLDVECFLGNTPLHCAAQRSYCKLVKLLLKKGVDVNARNRQGKTPIELIPISSHDFEEILNGLLLHGAEPSVEIFEKCSLEKAPPHIQENLFLYLFDEYSDFEMTFDALFSLTGNPAMFKEVAKCPLKIINGEYNMFVYFQILYNMDVDYLKIIIDKFGDSVGQAFEETEPYSKFRLFVFTCEIHIENLNLMFESNLKSSLMSFLDVWASKGLEPYLIRNCYTESEITELYCYLLSYGCDIQQSDLQSVLDKFGHCELFNILLHMDIKMDVSRYHYGNIMALLMYDVDVDLSDFFENLTKYSFPNIEKLLDYFADPKLKAFYLDKLERVYVAKKKDVPAIPLLMELARNAFRRYFIERFQVKTSSQFYTLLKRLPASNVHKKIITYETKLY